MGVSVRVLWGIKSKLKKCLRVTISFLSLFLTTPDRTSGKKRRSWTVRESQGYQTEQELDLTVVLQWKLLWDRSKRFLLFYTHIPHTIMMALLQSKNKKKNILPLQTLMVFTEHYKLLFFYCRNFTLSTSLFSPWNSQNMLQHCHWETHLSLG